jgi:hypothetical protein
MVMAFTKHNVKYVRLESVEVWADPDGSIHMASNDPDAKNLHLSISSRQAPGSYRQLAELLTRHGKPVPGWR